METFVGIAEQYQSIATNLVSERLGIDTELRFYVFAPEPGSFKQVLGVVVIAGIGGWLGTGGADMTRGFVSGLTGQTPEEWSFQVGQRLRDVLPLEDEVKKSETQGADVVDENTLNTAEFTAAIGDAAQAFVSTPTDELIERGFEPELLPNTFIARTELYYQLEYDPQVSGIGFGRAPIAPIRRSDFSRFQVKPSSREDEDVWKIELVKYRVSSPNWDRFDRRRKWKGRDVDGRFVYFTIDDSCFWEMAERQEIESSFIDELIAQAAIRYVEGRPIERAIVRVISFNDMIISPEMGAEEIAEFLASKNSNLSQGFFDD